MKLDPNWPAWGYEIPKRTPGPCNRTRCPTVGEIMRTVEDPELANSCCQDHFFYLRRWDGVWLLVYAEAKGEKNEIMCADWVEPL